MWTAPVTNRTLEDVEYARAHRNDDTLHKGAQNFSDWNRLAVNMYHLAELLENYGYVLTLRVRPNWKPGEIPYVREIDRFRIDLQQLRRAVYLFNSYTVAEWEGLGQTCAEIDARGRMAVEYYSKQPVPDLPYTHFEKINEIEKISGWLEETIAAIKKLYRPAGTFSAGQLSCLPRFVEPHRCDMTVLDFNLLYRTVEEMREENRTARQFYDKCFDPWANMTVQEFNDLNRTVAEIDAENRTASEYYRRRG